jgi:hypothetical protein
MTAKSNGNIYELINEVRLEIKSDIAAMHTALANNQGRLESKFNELEAGRLTRAEGNINDIKVNQATATTKLAILGFIASAIIGSVISVVVTNLLRK